MNSAPAQSVAPGVVRAELARILASDGFAHSPRLSRFLEYIVEQALAGHSDALKEYAVGVEVFGRPETFDPRTDAIVRVQAVSLRSRLTKYYENEGASDAVVIDCSKGSYIPVFRERTPASRTPSPGESGADAIAVLPFVNMSPDPDNEYFTDGLTEELISALSNVHGLRVVARTSVFQFKAKPADVRQIGAQLNARMILEGSVRKYGDRLRITAQLVDAWNGYETWSRTYRVEMKDLFTVQHEIASAIANSLREPDRPLQRHCANIEAYHAYLKGRFYLNKWTVESFRKSVQFFESAIAQDPTMPAAWSGLADALFVLTCYGNADPREVMPKARSAACRAMDIGDSLAEPHVSLGAVRAVYDFDWAGSEAEFLRAIELDSGSATAYQWYGVLCLLPQARLDEAERAVGRARDLDPLSPPINTSLGLVYFVQGRYDEAITYFEKALEIDPQFYLAHWWLALIYLDRSMPLKAIACLRRAGLLSRRTPEAALHFKYGDALIGRRGRARKMLNELVRLSHDQYVSPVMIAAIHVTLGDHAAAMGWLGTARSGRDPWLAWLGIDRRFDPLRADPRFISLLDDIGISWRGRPA